MNDLRFKKINSRVMYKMPVWFLWSLFDVKIEKASKPKIFLQIAKHHAVQIKNIAYLNEEYVVIELIDEEKKSRTIKVLKSEIIIMGSNSKDSDLVAHVIDQLIDRLKRINVKNPLLWELYAYFDKGLFGLGLAVFGDVLVPSRIIAAAIKCRCTGISFFGKCSCGSFFMEPFVLYLKSNHYEMNPIN